MVVVVEESFRSEVGAELDTLASRSLRLRVVVSASPVSLLLETVDTPDLSVWKEEV